MRPSFRSRVRVYKTTTPGLRGNSGVVLNPESRTQGSKKGLDAKTSALGGEIGAVKWGLHALWSLLAPAAHRASSLGRGNASRRLQKTYLVSMAPAAAAAAARLLMGITASVGDSARSSPVRSIGRLMIKRWPRLGS